MGEMCCFIITESCCLFASSSFPNLGTHAQTHTHTHTHDNCSSAINVCLAFYCWMQTDAASQFVFFNHLLFTLSPSPLPVVWVSQPWMSWHVRGNLAVRDAKFYFSVKDEFFPCQQTWLHHTLLDSPCSQFPLLSRSLSLPLCLLSLAIQRTDWGYYFTRTEFFCHAVIVKVPSCA